jgi:hypothetical protein
MSKFLMLTTMGNIKGNKKMEKEYSKVFMAEVRKVMNEKSCTIEAAANIVRRKHPALHTAYMNELLFLSGQTYDGK